MTANVSYMYGNYDTTLDKDEVMESDDIMISIPLEEYEELKEDGEWLDALVAAGVDSWDGVDFAQEIYDTFKNA